MRHGRPDLNLGNDSSVSKAAARVSKMQIIEYIKATTPPKLVPLPPVEKMILLRREMTAYPPSGCTSTGCSGSCSTNSGARFGQRGGLQRIVRPAGAGGFEPAGHAEPAGSSRLCAATVQGAQKNVALQKPRARGGEEDLVPRRKVSTHVVVLRDEAAVSKTILHDIAETSQ